VIATAAADLEHQVYEGRFRADLYARLSTLSIEIPPLRERGDDDLLLLVTHFLQVIGERAGHQVALAPEALQALRAYPWPGNVRELELVLDRALAGSERSVIALDDLPPAVAHGGAALGPGPAASLDESSRLSERDAILRAARQAAGSISRTAAILGVSRATLWRKMQRHGLAREDLRS
jgi:transcriptional activator for dhaKLM operon